MIQKKICMLGTFAVGKTSLVRRFVESIYSDKYHTTVGVKIDKKTVKVGNEEVMLLLWDIQGEEKAQDLRKSYLRGAAGYLLVADGTRRDTLYTALTIQTRAQDTVGAAPFILLINKSDLVDQWQLEERELDALADRGWHVIKTSAKSGTSVEEAFLSLAKRMLEV
ncbi:MAG: GTP-binding protein [Acidobacteriota bacterium]|nr:GTP-binding protein [Acidobacteriota bacterium]